MRTFFLLAVLGLGTVATARADDPEPVERFDGHTSLTTSDFKVPDGWEVRWHSSQNLSIGIIRLDNSVVAGASGMNNGSLYLPHGGTFRLRIKGEEPIPWDVAVYAIGTKAPPETADMTPFYVPTPGPADVASTNAPTADVPPPAAPTNAAPVAPPAPAPIPTQLTETQLKAVVTIKGDRIQGSGVLLKMASGPVVITSLHLLANNPRMVITTQAGSEVKVTTFQAAPDRDLAMLGIQDNAYTYLEPATDTGTSVQMGDTVLTAKSNDESSGDDAEKVTLVDAPRIDFDNFDDPGDVGGPIIQPKTGKVIAIISSSSRVLITNNMDNTTFATRDAATATSLSYFGLRFDTVTNWEAHDWARFANETQFLDIFHQRSRALDSYINGKANDFRPTAKLYLTDPKIKSANDTYVQSAAGGDNAQRTQALRGLLFELSGLADTDMDQIQLPSNFYTFSRQRALDEIAYRKALKAQIDNYSNDPNKFAKVARRNN